MNIDSRTKVPLAMVGVTFVALIGGILWLTEIRSIAMQNRNQIIRTENLVIQIRSNHQAFQQKLWDTTKVDHDRLANIEGKLDIIYDMLKNKHR